MSPSKSLKSSFLGLFAVSCLHTAALGQHASVETVANFSVDSGLYVIASDQSNAAAGYDRDTIRSSADVTLGMKATDPPLNVTYRVAYQLLRADNSLVTLKIGAGTGTQQNGNPFALNLAPGVPISNTANGAIRPHDTLVPGDLYRMRILLQCHNGSNWVTRKTATAAPRQFLHFPSTTSLDTALNALAVIDSVTFNRISALQTAANVTGRSFEGRVAFTIHRYDAFGSASPTTNIVPFRINYGLSINTLNTPIPIEDGITGPGYNVAQHVAGAVKTPATRSVARNFLIEPSNQIQSVTKAFYITVDLSHTEQTGTIRHPSPSRLPHLLPLRHEFAVTPAPPTVAGDDARCLYPGAAVPSGQPAVPLVHEPIPPPRRAGPPTA